ncbi:copper chaperone CopZ [Oceanobacillus bengalensis]|jgi:copper chaperone|uniref:Copper chaperone CopZ n=1 Tax=Oceanobacillus bengalensis TaxID=1435466 RepID=A0A494YV81_9BACI|nr:copper chaperone CopZ [Oceanobacillus bengalensis]RKQ14032.1 copper chaperone [Oceanobacillus bengalensis]
MQTLTLDVKGMTCGHCKMSVEGALNELEGVSNVEVDLTTGNVTVSYDESKVTLESLRNAIEDQGYDVVA